MWYRTHFEQIYPSRLDPHQFSDPVCGIEHILNKFTSHENFSKIISRKKYYSLL